MSPIQDAAFAPHQVDSLFLLVGTNPLPNAVAGQLLTRRGGQVVLVKTNRTGNQAGQIDAWLQRKLGVKPIHLEVADSDGATIYDAVYGAASKAARERRRLGLNYTGGTKAMAVHAYRAVEAAARDAGAECEFSYLDGRRLRMTFDPGHGRAASIPVIGLAPFTIEELTDLHGWTLYPKPRRELPLSDIATTLAVAYRDAAVANGWATWAHEVLEKHCRKQKDGKLTRDWKNKTDLNNTTLEWPTQPGLAEAIAMLKKLLGDDGPTFNVGALARATGFGNAPEALCRWLHGLWFESFVLDAIGQIASDCNLSDHGANLNGVQGVKGSGEETTLEFDVAAMRGYQFFGLSCTTASEDLINSKLFEAFIRARQLGGDEARVALVCFTGRPEHLERKLRSDFADDDNQLKVFGRDHVGDLPAHLARWIEG